MTPSVPAKMTTGVIEAGMTMHAATRAIAGGGHAAQPIRDDRGHRENGASGRRDGSADRLQGRRERAGDPPSRSEAGTGVGAVGAVAAGSGSRSTPAAPEKLEADKKAERLAKLEAWKKRHEQKLRMETDGAGNKTPTTEEKPFGSASPVIAPSATPEAKPEITAAAAAAYTGKFDPKAIAKKSAARHPSPEPLRPVLRPATGNEKVVPPAAASTAPARRLAATANKLSAGTPFSGFGFGKGAADGASSKRKLNLDDEETSKRKLAKLPDVSLEDADDTPYNNQDEEDDEEDDGRFAGTEEELAAAARAARARRDERLQQQQKQSSAMETDEPEDSEATGEAAAEGMETVETKADTMPVEVEMEAETAIDAEKAQPVEAQASPPAEAMQLDEPPVRRRANGHVERRVAPTVEISMSTDDNVDPLDAFMADLSHAPDPSTRRKVKKPAAEPEAYFSDDDDYFSKAQNGIDTKSILAMATKRKKKDIPTIDYSKMELTPIRKNFWVEPHELSELTEAEVAELRLDLDGIKVSGKDVPKPVQKWSHCGLTRPMLEVIEQLGYDKPTAIQMQALPVIMSGRDVIGVAKTGSGKTMAFLVPMFRHIMDQERVRDDGPIGLILTPTRELAVQIHRDCKPFAKKLGLRAVCAYGGPPIKDQIAELKRGAEIVVATTGRMIDLLAANQGRVVSLRRTTYIVLDEADRMFDMGFEPQVMKIFANIRPDRQTLLFSATMPRIIDALVKKVLHSPVEITVGGKSVVAPEITQMVEVRDEKDKFLRLLELLGELYMDDDDVRALIFVERQEKADELLRELLRKGYACMSLHGGKDQSDRDSTISDFKKGVCPVLVATSVAARGLDVKQLKLVVNYDAPNHLEDYVHRAGRTGRAGNTGTAVTFVTEEQENCAPGIAKALEQSGQPVPERLLEMRKAWREKVKTGKAKDQSGFGGKGLEKLDKDREAARLRERKTHKAEGEDDDFDKETAAEDEKKAKAASSQAQLAASMIVSRDAAKAEGVGGGENDKGAATGDDKRGPAGATAAAAGATGGALEKAASAISDINARLARAGQLRPGQPVDNKGPDAGAFHATLEINDFPQKGRWAVTNRTNVAKILDSTGVSITTKGTFYGPGKEPGPGAEAKLYLLIEGDTELSVGNALTELTRLLREGTVAAADAESRAPASGRYTVT
ncbi:dead deah box RNA helicase [Grosmannia clavigera kw1407]|uniref:RNA helicase n=1 Tax=Grosmannia clavigera (strain kw1407 / UAMH 11150) TaxID=655863 RepID=F0XIG5_GROCL|nr:dead deah box RNA helicase [Grosmannia clavigera kw1407]EFX02556.1 dead deah box RNA helicase [Grosmannia clavigera kw1407]